MGGWALSDVLKYFQEDKEIKEALRNEDFKELVNPNHNFLKLLKSALEYQGFDPRVVMKQIIRNRKSYESTSRARMEWDLSNVNDEFQVKADSEPDNLFSNEESLHKDLSFLIMMFLLRNNHISKIIQKSVSGLDSILEMLKEKYEINDDVRKSGTSLSSKDVTLPRIASVLPSVAVHMFHSKSVKEIVPYLTIPGVLTVDEALATTSEKGKDRAESSDVSHAICCPFLPSLHPRSAAGSTHIHALMLYVAVRMDDIIHKKEKNFTPLSNLLTYYRAGYESPATPEAARVEVMRKVHLVHGEGKQFGSKVLHISKECYKALSNMRTDDASHGVLMEAARTGIIPE